MAKDLTNEVEYYYDYHPLEEDLMGETSWHDSLIDYLKAVLLWLFRGQDCAIYSNLNFYRTRNRKEYPIAPDLAVIKGIPFRHVRSWTLWSNPAPQVVFEILSEETWQKDLEEKPAKYAKMGVLEYFAYDPYDQPINRNTASRLVGWRLNPERHEMVKLEMTEQGCLWSAQLDSWLVPDQSYLHLYDRSHQLRLTGEQAQAQLAEAGAERAAAAIRQAQVLAEKLRSLGINPDEL